MKKSGAAVLIMLLLLTGCGDTLDEKHIEERQTEKTSQTEEQEQIPTGNTEVQLENSVEKYSAETEQQRYALNLPEAYRSKIYEIDDYIHRRMEEGLIWEDEICIRDRFDTFADGYTADNVFIQADAAYTKAGKYSVTWNFSTIPSETWKDGVGSALLEYAQGTGDWDRCV